ncbi:Nif3-like dinuclear metal center hexameric protein [Legionella impletisoli]|uniref:GTP cyclohydrolase 1 type 2 homolog n=1 Tax=Legionella impletisoli TaxID=343510 RepID=A0A917JQZ9_9GAMM|nr:Nif3-like dinuclear metal center hexameric protein [Legionella impletisoli]GGI81134.1 GTP cyclohydrolase 1 type 2 [Legionella impletisoli]
MIKRSNLSQYLDEFLSCASFQDYAPNGLQVEGKDTIHKICTAVTASEKAIEEAIAKNADALLVHHGYFWRGEDPTVKGIKKRRLGLLLASELNLFAYHLPLDCHATLGNNACLAKRLEVGSIQSHKINKTPDLLWSGTLKESLSIQKLTQLITHKLNQTPFVIHASDKPIQQIAWCSGAAQDYIDEAVALGVDAYLSGEVSERTYYLAKELGIHYLACGHHASERFGIQALGEHLSQEFELSHEFIDSDNPI